MLRSLVSVRKVPKWAVGVAVATPTMAAIQGCLLLNDYRTNHGNAPRPVSPSRGVVVVRAQSSRAPRQRGPQLELLAPSPETESCIPLRLLVIGDSLAAGVGTSKSSTPILPESIALSLSKALGGRPVYWKCVGTPGASAAQIVHDIRDFPDTPEENNVLKGKVADWLEAKQRAQHWFQGRMGQDSHCDECENEGKPVTLGVKTNILKWWRIIRRDVRELNAVIQNKGGDQDTIGTRKEGRENALKEATRPQLLADEGSDQHYDVAVVVTGINDLKDSVLPWMKQMKNQNGAGGLHCELLRVVQALKRKMKLDLQNESQLDTNKQLSDALVKRRRPIVVFPAIPTSPLPIFQYAPLSWFAVPLILAMEQNKKKLSEKFPRSILFVEPPSPSLLSDIEAGRGTLAESRLTEDVLFRLTDVTHRAREKVETLMAQHYQKWANKKDTRVGDTTQMNNDVPRDAFQQCCHDHQLVESSKIAGASFICPDNIHPNDEGYDFWGRHIAEAIVQEWNK